MTKHAAAQLNSISKRGIPAALARRPEKRIDLRYHPSARPRNHLIPCSSGESAVAPQMNVRQLTKCA